jgi:hypothetical protein
MAADAPAAAAALYATTTVAALASPAAPAPPPPPGLATSALAAAAAFTLLDALITRLPLAAWLTRYARTPPPGPKAASRLAREVAIKLVGVAHLAIQLPLAVAALTGPTGRAAFGGLPLTFSAGSASVSAARLYASTPLTHAAVAVSAGYFLWDVASLLPRVSIAGPAMLAHGCLCAALYWYGALSGHLSFYGSLFVLWEASTPAVYARWLASELGWGPGTRPYAVAGGAMMVSFFVARVVGGAAASAAFWASARSELSGRPPARSGAALPAPVLHAFRAANVGMTALNLYWFGRMVAGLVRLVARARAGPGEAVCVGVGGGGKRSSSGGGGGGSGSGSAAGSPRRPSAAGLKARATPRRASEE